MKRHAHAMHTPCAENQYTESSTSDLLFTTSQCYNAMLNSAMTRLKPKLSATLPQKHIQDVARPQTLCRSQMALMARRSRMLQSHCTAPAHLCNCPSKVRSARDTYAGQQSSGGAVPKRGVHEGVRAGVHAGIVRGRRLIGDALSQLDERVPRGQQPLQPASEVRSHLAIAKRMRG